ncbi:MAG: hypothetical protein Q7V57_13955 [Actinomycetota bacterium]|nr:hypothetical protein [Actinomycetota bacterium]
MHTRGMRRSAVAALAAMSVACTSGATVPAGSSGASTTVVSAAELPAPLEELLAVAADRQWFTHGDDTFDVWICHVPLDSTASMYAGTPLRLALTPADVAEVLNRQVTPYYDTLSHGLYHPVFNAGGEVQMAVADEPQACLDEAIAEAGAGTNAVFAVADADHGSSDPGGFGSVGEPCAVVVVCAVGATNRSAYIGAADFHAEWGDQQPMDLAEHEVGHTLGWMHSGVEDRGGYLSALDVMSNSAAPRDVDATRRDGPDTLALNRLLAGWLPRSAVWNAPTARGTVTLAPSMSAAGTRVAVVAIDDNHFLTIELLTADGFNDHLPADGIAVHRVEVSGGVVQNSAPLVGEAPYADLLQVGASLTAGGWRITVDAGGGDGPDAAWTVTILPSVEP